MLVWQALAATVGAYMLGCFSSAYYIVRLVKGQDIRQLGSGTAGGRNAGRVLGRAGFVAVAVLDALKGLLAVLLASSIGLAGWWLVPVMIAVVAGHVWPAQLGFRGGKGIATMVGVLLAYNYLLALILLALFALFFVIFRSATLALIAAIVLLPIVMLLISQPVSAVVAVAGLALVLVYVHRANILARLRRQPADAVAK